jgi:hypothetical protein
MMNELDQLKALAELSYAVKAERDVSVEDWDCCEQARVAELEKSRINRITCDFTDCQWQRKGKRLDAALAELLRLKLIKDTHGKTPEYLLLQPLAWEQARKARGQGNDDD